MIKVIRKDKITPSEQRLAELILFFAKQSKEDLFFGSIKLNKLLFLADFKAYGHLGKSITGISYIHQRNGPTPEPGQFLSVRDRLIEQGKLEIKQEETYAGIRKRPVSLHEPDLSLFTNEEKEICLAAIEELKHMTAQESRDWSHKILGWLYTEEGETIPYESIYLWTKNSLTADDMQWAIQTAGSLGVELNAA